MRGNGNGDGAGIQIVREKITPARAGTDALVDWIDRGQAGPGARVRTVVEASKEFAASYA